MYPVFPDATAPGPVKHRPAGQPARGQEFAELMAGNARFCSGQPRYGHFVAAARAVADATAPFAAVLGCMDARVPVEAIFDQDFGAVCAIRSAGPTLDSATTASLRLAVTSLRVGLVVVLGHRGCAAVGAAVAARRSGEPVAADLRRLFDAIGESILDTELNREDAAELTAVRHVDGTVRRLRKTLPVPVRGAIYDVASGRVIG